MNRAEVLNKLHSLKPWLESEGIVRVRLVGSYARTEEREDSNNDLLVEFREMPGLRFFAIERELSQLLGAPVELLLEAGMNPVVRARMLEDAVDA
jgi:uncharacterized protein